MKRRSVPTEWLICVLALAGFAVAAAAWGWFSRIDQTLYDAGMTLLGRPAPANIAIVAIDQRSLDRIGRWPWRRAVHATLLDRLTEAHAGPVGIDILFSEADRADPAGDEVLAAAIRRNGRVVLPVLMELLPGGAPRQVPPAPALAAGAAALGHVHVELDADGVARSVFLREGQGAADRPHMALALAALRVGGRSSAGLPGERRIRPREAPAATDAGVWLRDHWVHIAFLGPPGHVQRYSYVDVLLDNVAARELEGKYVIVGATAAGLLDAYPTPVSGHGRSMPGAEIMANVLDGLLNDRFVRIAPRPWNALAAALMVFALLASFLRLSPRRAAIASAIACCAALAGAYAALLFAGWWLAPSAAVAGLAACYPVWSWRRLEATQWHMEQELERFAREPELFAQAAATRHTDTMGDLVEQRIGQVRRATRELRDARRFVVDTVNGLPEGALVADTELRVLLANPRASSVLDLGAQALAGKRLPEVLAPVAAAGALPWETFIVRTPLEFEVRHPSGRDLLVAAVPFSGVAGERRGLLVSLVDVSLIKQAERAREETLRFVSHDLRSPLASIIALLDLEELAPEEVPKDMHPRIRRYVERSLSLSDDFVQLGRAEAVDASRFEPVDLAEILRAAIEEAQSLADKKNMRIALAAAPELAAAVGIRDVLQRIFINLLSNAVKYSPAATRIECSIQREGERWAVLVADQGEGIPPEQLLRLFGRFERVGAEKRSRGPGGAGLGLAFVKAAVEKHGGTVEAQSELGRGTRFIVRLPARE